MKKRSADYYLEFLRSLPKRQFTHAVTLTLKQGLPLKGGTFHPLTPEIAASQVCRLNRQVNQAVFRSSYRRHIKQLAWVSCIETQNDRIHYHIAIEFPQFESWDDYSNLLLSIWNPSNMEWAHRENCVKPYLSDGWLNYMLPHGFEAIDLRNTHRADFFGQVTNKTAEHVGL